MPCSRTSNSILRRTRMPDMSWAALMTVRNRSACARISRALPVAERYLHLPMLTPSEVGAVIRVAACSVWSTVSMGIYHSLHCG